MSEMSDEKKDPRHETMLAALAQGMTWEEAAERVGVSDRTLYRWCQADPDLAASASLARNQADDMVQAVTFTNCLDPDPAHNSLRMFWLKSRRRAVFGEISKVVNSFEKLPDDELIRLTTGDPPGNAKEGPESPPIANPEAADVP